MGILVKMRQVFLFSFFFLCSILIVSSYSAGEELNLSYSNITNVTYPCLLINQSIYLSGNIPIGNNNCTITYFDNVTEQIIIDNNDNNGGGGGGGSSSRTRKCTARWRCTEWGNCKQGNKATRECTNTNNCYKNKPKEERYCYYYVQKEKAEVIPIEEYIQGGMEEIEQTQKIEEPEPQEEEGMAFLWWILIGVFIVMVLIMIVYMIYGSVRTEK